MTHELLFTEDESAYAFFNTAMFVSDNPAD
ncbi:hypothetical protein MSIMFI_01845 [Mycobacterium simulans]|nr:hypothetical protein MSIMFI_01845 [Mycobacterium simulans]